MSVQVKMLVVSLPLNHTLVTTYRQTRLGGQGFDLASLVNAIYANPQALSPHPRGSLFDPQISRAPHLLPQTTLTILSRFPPRPLLIRVLGHYKFLQKLLDASFCVSPQKRNT